MLGATAPELTLTWESLLISATTLIAMKKTAEFTKSNCDPTFGKFQLQMPTTIAHTNATMPTNVMNL